jgi:hypothetical protein
LKEKKIGKKCKHFPPKKIQNFYIADKIIEEKNIKINSNYSQFCSQCLKKNLKKFELFSSWHNQLFVPI